MLLAGGPRFGAVDSRRALLPVAAVAEHDAVIFADASVNGAEPFFFNQIFPADTFSFSSHSCEPEAVLALSRDLFNKDVPGFALGIRGYDFNEFGQKLSLKAQSNLDEAVAFLRDLLTDEPDISVLIERAKNK